MSSNIEKKKLKRVVIKEELVALTQNTETAIILQQFVYWMERVRDFDKFLVEENERRLKNHEESLEINNGWIYKTAKELKEETMLDCTPKTISNKLSFLVENEWLQRRNNPKYKWDRTYQYRVNLNKLCADLADLGYCLEGYPLYKPRDDAFVNISHRKEIVSNRSSENFAAIPETTTKTTTENTLNNGFFPDGEKTAYSFYDFIASTNDDEIDEDTIEAITYYLETYQYHRKCNHPNLKTEQWQRVVDTILHCVTDSFERDYYISLEEEQQIIDHHFNTEYSIDCDYNILHYISGDIRVMRYLEIIL